MAISHPAAQRGAWDLQGPLSKPLLPAQPLQAPCPACRSRWSRSGQPRHSPGSGHTAMPGDAACQGLAPAQRGIGDIAHVHGRHIAGSSAAQRLGTRGIWPPPFGPPKPRGCCSRQHHPAGTGMGPAAAVPPGRGAAMPSGTAALSSSASDPQPHSPRARSSSVEPG